RRRRRRPAGAGDGGPQALARRRRGSRARVRRLARRSHRQGVGGRLRPRPQRLQDHAGGAPGGSRDRRGARGEGPMSSVNDWAGTNPIKEARSGVCGAGVDRYEGPLKVTGTAPYAYEVQPPSPPAYGVMIGAAIAAGRVSGADTAEAEASPGVKLVW